jgi:hypothetical protein
MRTCARAEYERKYTAEANYTQLIDIYEAAMGSCPVALRLQQSAAV